MKDGRQMVIREPHASAALRAQVAVENALGPLELGLIMADGEDEAFRIQLALDVCGLDSRVERQMSPNVLDIVGRSYVGMPMRLSHHTSL